MRLLWNCTGEKWSNAMTDPATSPCDPGTLTGSFVAMVQCSVSSTSQGSGFHTVGLQFTAWANTAAPGNPADWVEVGSQNSFIKVQHPGCASVPMAFVTFTAGNQPIRFTITPASDPSINTPHTELGTSDFYSIAVAELEQTGPI